MKTACTLCGCSYNGLYAFKAGYICENCVQQMKTDHLGDTKVRINHQ